MKRTCVLLVLDGWGVGRNDFSNPIQVAQPKTIDFIKHHYPIGALQASGISVGLPWNEEGNSEVGHLTIGAGKVIYQHYPRITLAIQNGDFFKNPVFLNAFEHVQKNNSALNIIGLLTEGNIHASFEHLEALLQCAKDRGVSQVNLHMFLDGKDSRPRSALNQVAKLQGVLDQIGIGRIASLSGRYYGLDRDGHWDRTAAAYRVMTEVSPVSSEKLETVLARTYESGNNDDYTDPIIVGPEAHPVQENDAVIFTDFREDSIRQIASAFILPDFNSFPTKQFKNVFVATLTDYSKQFKVPVAFPNEDINAPLGKVLSDAGKVQMLVAETEKYAHVTYFFNGYRDEPFPNQFRVLVPSRNVMHHDEHPEMMAEEIGNRIVEAVEDKGFNFIIANFANADMIAHTGNYDAAVVAINTIDAQVERIYKACKANDAALIITADHGHVEKMKDPYTGMIETRHDANMVPVYVVMSEFYRTKSEAEVAQGEREVVGILSDVAPTVLEVLGVSQPAEMKGKSLLRYLT